MPRELTDYNFTSSHRSALNYEELFNGRIWRLEHGVDFMGTPRFCAGRVRKAARARSLNVRIDVGATFVVLRVVGTMNATRVQPQPQQHQVTEALPAVTSARYQAFIDSVSHGFCTVTSDQRCSNEQTALQQITRNTDFDVTPEMRAAAAGHTYFVWQSDDVDLLVMDSVPLAIPLRQIEAAGLRALLPFTNSEGRQLVFERVTQFTRHLQVNDGWRVVHLSGGYYSHRSGENVSITEPQAAYMVACIQFMRLHSEQQPQFVWREASATVHAEQPASLPLSTPCEPASDTTPQSAVVVDDQPTPPQSTVTRRTTTSTTTTSTPTTPHPTLTRDEWERRRSLLQRRRQAAEPQPQTTTTSTTTTSPEAADAPAEEASSASSPAFAAAVHALRQYTNREHRPANALLQAGQRWVWDSRLNRWCVRAQRRGPSGS